METVGVGQVEVEVAGKADTTVVVVNPGWGDAVQANKAGLMEIADVFVINKADRAGVAETRRDLELMLDLSELRRTGARRSSPRVATDAARGSVDGLAARSRPPRSHREVGGTAASVASERTARRAAQHRRRVVWRPGPASCAGGDATTARSATVLGRAASTRGPPPTSCSAASAPDRGD